ncbi:FAD dependent oxidoreductase [Caldalkalibacillus thermarum TA2.A1]|uniref:Glycerol-3-phosphate dehydrogenase n=1 Tax=Caldalkalibacillus thermarum (strain TA2.A1) TaxID=986075 RepID=F5L762_CALTT|nr:glycerol-3-phosphate dehydrogenase/oxidase [Caldalkalibacillus thermarum]EGL82838.1 FAD dependent oxidoreductase [Caldalkalibacillus thermarum TA2.A1]
MGKEKLAFSRDNRSTMLERMAGEPLDLLVIGGGITGCGIALDATLRGLRVGLIEMQDFAAGTSSRSTKLIHGGLRYLKQGEIGLVREVGRERAILYRNAPHVVIPEPMLLPLVEGGTYGRLATSFGLWLYDRLAGVEKSERRVMLNKEETLAREPLLKKDGLKGSGLYVEYRTDDARLTLEVIKSAVEQGALAVNYAEATEFIYDQGKLIGVAVTDRVEQREYTIYAAKIVNATGPWVDQLRRKDNSLKGKRLHLTKGVHIVVDQSRFPLRQAVYFDVPDGRMVFAIPRDGKTYIGTTDTDYQGDLAHPPVDEEDITYLLEAANAMFPTIGLTRDDVESHWAGLRPLIHEDGKSPSELSRKDEIFRSESGLITIAGGKLTGFRKMAERVVDLVVRELEQETGRTFLPCQTATQVLSGGQVGGPEGWPGFVQKHVQELAALNVEKEQAEKLVHRYGSNIRHIIGYLKRMGVQEPEVVVLDPAEGKQHIDPVLKAELCYCVQHEMAVYAEDYLIRRTGAAYFDKDTYVALYPVVNELLNPPSLSC